MTYHLPPSSPLPFVSILIPIRNEGGYISQCLKAVLDQDYPPDQIEILIADGMSTDNTRQVIQSFQANHPNVFLFHNPGEIVPIGMNILIPQAKGEILIRVDGHCVIAPVYVSNCVRHLQQGDMDGVGGPMRTIGEDFTSEVIALAMSSKFGVGNSSFRTETGQTKLADTVPFPAYTREIIVKVGLYDEELVRNQDDEYNYRIREAGGKILLADDVRSTYFSRGSFAKLWKQYFQYGYWKVRVLQKHPRQMSPRQFIPPAFVLALIFSLLLTVFTSWGWIALLALVGTYLLANFTASILTISGQIPKSGDKVGTDSYQPLKALQSVPISYHLPPTTYQHLLLLPLTFLILHVSYGFGFILGLIKFINRWGDKIGLVPKVSGQID